MNRFVKYAIIGCGVMELLPLMVIGFFWHIVLFCIILAVIGWFARRRYPQFGAAVGSYVDHGLKATGIRK